MSLNPQTGIKLIVYNEMISLIRYYSKIIIQIFYLLMQVQFQEKYQQLPLKGIQVHYNVMNSDQ